jgi:hypothetical protein
LISTLVGQTISIAGQTGFTATHGFTSTLTDENAEHEPSLPML